MNMSTLYFFQVHIRGAWKYARSLSSKAASSIAFSWWGCKDESSLTWWICFRQDSLPDTAIPFIPLSPFNKVITQHTDLGWFRCAFWISRRTLSVPGKWLWIWWSDKLCVCLYTCVCIGTCTSVCRWVNVCMCIWTKAEKLHQIYRILFRKTRRFLGFSELLWKRASVNTEVLETEFIRALPVLSVADNTHAKCRVRTSVSLLWIWTNCFILMLFKPFHPPSQLTVERTYCVLLTVASGSQRCCTAVPWMRGYQPRDCVWYWGDLRQMANAIWSAWHMVAFSDAFYFQTELQRPEGTSKNSASGTDGH